MYMEDGCSVPLAQPIRKAVNIPVVVDGKIREPELAEKILKEGKADFIGIANIIESGWVRDSNWDAITR